MAMSRFAGLFLALWFAGHLVRADSVVVFNEIMYHPPVDETSFEWLELYNQMAVDVELSGWSISAGVQYTFPEGTILPGGAYLVVAIDPDSLKSATGLTNIHGPFSGRLSNSGERLTLRNHNGRLMDTVRYGTDGEWPVAPDGSGVSLAKIDPQSASGFPENWRASSKIGGTPGEPNFPSPSDSAPAVLLPLDAAWRHEGNAVPGWFTPSLSDADWQIGSGLFVLGNPKLPPGEPALIPTLFGTGWNADGKLLSDGSPDPHFVITRSAQGTPPPPEIPATVISPHPAWVGSDPTSLWIGVTHPGTANVAPGRYDFRTQFDLAEFDPETAEVSLEVAVDNSLSEVLLNGNPLGISHEGFASFSAPFLIRNGFQPGLNQLEFRTVNAGSSPNPAGFRARIAGTGRRTLPINSELPAAPAPHYFRAHFVFDGDPSTTELQLRFIAQDGAVFHLNGIEAHRFNLPDGILTASTPALSEIHSPELAGPIPIPAGALITGTNLLAVELRQASKPNPSAVFGAELSASTVPAKPAPLAFNEVAGEGDNSGVELINSSDAPVSLEGFVVHRAARGAHRGFVLPPGEPLEPGGHFWITAEQLGFSPAAGDRLFLYSPNRMQVLDAVVVQPHHRARFPDASGPWFNARKLTPGAPNQVDLRNEIVINEIMYHPRPLGFQPEPPLESPLLPVDYSWRFNLSDESWIELHNRSDQEVDLTNWSLDGGIEYEFPAGTLMAPGGYLVVAKEAAHLRTIHPEIPMVGDFQRRLSRKSDHLILRDANGNPANEVRYFDAYPWPVFADGHGSSLELRNPEADNSRPEAWAASDETARSSWKTYTYRGIAEANIGPTRWNEFVLGLLMAGEALLDDISVIESPDGAARELIQNGSFNKGAAGWRLLGNHRHSRVIVDPGNPANRVLHLVAAGPTEHMHNHVETTLADGARIVNGREYQISFRAKWLGGANRLNTRLYFNRLPRTTLLEAPSYGGTPGAQNSRFEPNLGPTFTGLQHQPLVPKPNEPVTVSINASDPDGVANCVLWWAVEGRNWNEEPMSLAGNGRFTASIPPQPASTLVQFHVEAVDTLGARSTYPPEGPDSRALYQVAGGQTHSGQLHLLRILMTSADAAFLHAATNVMSNERLRGTIIYNDQEVFYNSGVRLQGSQRGRLNDSRVGFTLRFPADQLFRGVHHSITIDRSGGYSGRGGRQDEILLRHIANQAGGLPDMYNDLVRLDAPRPQHAGPGMLIMAKYHDLFLDSAFENGSDGAVFKMELIYFPTTTAGGHPEAPKLPQPDEVIGTDLQNLGEDKEVYRWNFLIENNRRRDDYTPLLELAQAFSLSGSDLERETSRLMDIDQWMRAFALKSLSGDVDTYGQGYPHNQIIYFRPDGKALAFPWDMDFAWTRSVTAPLAPEANIGRIINLPANRRLFFGHLDDLINTVYNRAYLSRWAAHYGSLVSQNYGGILEYIDQRASHVRSQLPPMLPFRITSNNGENFMTSEPLANLAGSAGVHIREVRLAGSAQPFDLEWRNVTAWQTTVPLALGQNHFAFVAYDFNGNSISTNHISITSTASSGAPDSDGDGIPDVWELAHGLNPLVPDAHLDFDNDGMTNFQEYLAGTDPRDPASVLRLELNQTPGAPLQLTFRAAAGRSYAIQISTDLAKDQWETVAEFPPRLEEAILGWTIPESLSQANFFRLATGN